VRREVTPDGLPVQVMLTKILDSTADFHEFFMTATILTTSKLETSLI
jgi:hypothetical protein